MAERLSADSGCRVTVLEAGVGGPDIESMVRDSAHLPIGPASPVVQRYRTLLTQDPPRSASLVRGCAIGGSGAVNGGYFCRALPDDFDSTGVPGWFWRDVEPHYRATTSDLDAVAHVDDARIRVSRTTELAGPSREFTDAAIEAGYRWLPDLNAEPVDRKDLRGVGAVPLNIVRGMRIGPGEVFLGAASGRPNLVVRTRTRVLRLRMNGSRAVGVDALGPEGRIYLAADRIVLSAGAIATAHLLMLSGIGPAVALKPAGIEIVGDLPVGQRCWDHPEWMVPTAATPITNSNNRPVLEVVLVSDRLEVRPYTKGFGAMTRTAGPLVPDPVHIGVALMRPRSRARISLVSDDPADAPKIEHRYDSDPEDVADLRRGHQLLMNIMGSKAALGQPEWATSQHLCGSAPMGRDADEWAVVDPQCRVRGVERLWVVDGSVLPSPLGRGPHATIVMLGHRAAEFV